MKGSVYKAVAPNGRVSWRYRIDAGRDENGKRIRLSESGFRLEREAYDAMHKAMQDYSIGRVNTRGTLREFLDRWLRYHIKAKPLAPKTAERYASLAARATGSLGDVALKDLTPFMLDHFYVRLAQTRKIDAKEVKGLSAKTIREVHNVLHVALKRAVKTKFIAFNPPMVAICRV